MNGEMCKARKTQLEKVRSVFKKEEFRAAEVDVWKKIFSLRFPEMMCTSLTYNPIRSKW